MVDNGNNKKRKESISEADIATLLQRYDTNTILKMLQEMAYYAEPKMDWNKLVKKTTTGITNAREYQLLWRHLAYRDSLLPVEDDAQLQDDDSDMECELEASPAGSIDAASEAVAYVKVMAASYVPSESGIPEDSTVEAPLTINIPYGLHSGAQEPSDSYWSTRGINITFPVSLQKAAEGQNGNGLAGSMASRKKRKKWSDKEDVELITAVKRHGEGSWALIAKEDFEGERTASQLSQRWGAIKRRCDTANTSTQSGLQRTEAQMAANRALSLAVGNRVPSKKLAVGIPPMLSSGSITGAQANGASSGGSSLQGQQRSQPLGHALPRAARPAPATKSRVPAKKTTSNSSTRAELMITANSVAAAACMAGVATATSVPKTELGKNSVSVSVPKTEPGKNSVSVSVPKTESVKPASAALLPCPSGMSSALSAEPVKPASTVSLPRPSGISSTLKAEPAKPASSALLPRPSGIISTPKAEPVKTSSTASLSQPSQMLLTPKPEPMKATTSAAFVSRPSVIISAPKAEPVKTATSTASLPRPPGISSASKTEPVKTAVSAPSLPRPSGIISAPKTDLVKTTASAASLPRPSSIPSAQKAGPVKNVPAAATNTRAVGPSNLRHAINGSPNHTISSSPSTKPSPMAPLSKGPTIQNNSVPPSFASSRLVPTQRVPAATGVPHKPSVGAAVTSSSRPVGVQKVQTQGDIASFLITTTPQTNKTISTNSVISTGKPVAAKVETPPSLMQKKNEVVDSCNDKSKLDKPPEKEDTTKVSPLIGVKAESKPKDEANKGKSQDVATVTGTEQKGL